MTATLISASALAYGIVGFLIACCAWLVYGIIDNERQLRHHPYPRTEWAWDEELEAEHRPAPYLYDWQREGWL